jgi:hypothetical protein
MKEALLRCVRNDHRFVTKIFEPGEAKQKNNSGTLRGKRVVSGGRARPSERCSTWARIGTPRCVSSTLGSSRPEGRNSP